MVYFKFAGIYSSGIWTYSVKLYEDTMIHQDDAIVIDVISSKHESELTVNFQVFRILSKLMKNTILLYLLK